jgi:hypothetical protein
MALITEDGTGLASAESYISVSSADTYHSARRAPAAWISASDAEKEAALRQATEYLDAVYERRWLGVRKTQDQALDWPRYGVQDTAGWELGYDEVPIALARATAELAVKALSEELMTDLDQTGTIEEQDVTVGPIKERVKYVVGSIANKRWTFVEQLISPLIISKGGVKLARV